MSLAIAVVGLGGELPVSAHSVPNAMADASGTCLSTVAPKKLLDSGPHEVGSFSRSQQADSLIDGKAAGHDDIFTAESFSASEPAMHAVNAAN
jgi:hypothetical protein